MIKVKDGYAKLIGTTYLGSADRVLLSNGGDIGKAVASTANTLVLRNSSGLIESTLATGTAPFKITSTTLNTNLNADMLDGVHLAGYGGRSGVMRSWARRTYTTVNLYFGNGNVVVIDPKPTDDSTLSNNTIIFSLGDVADRNTLLAFMYERDEIKYRRAVTGPTWSAWKTIAFTDSDISGTAAYANILKSNNTTSVPTGLLFYAGWLPQGNTNNRSWCSPTGNCTNNVKGEYGSIVRVNYNTTYYNELFFDANSTRPSWRKITGTNSTGWKTLGLLEDIRPSGYVTSSTASLSSYWGKLWECTYTTTYHDLDITFYLHSAYNLKRGFVHIRVRRNPVTTDGVTTYIHDVNLVLISGNIPTSEIRLYHDATSGKMELWVDVKARYGVYNANVISCTLRYGNESIPVVGTLFSNDFTTVLTLPTYSYITLSNLNSNQVHVLLHTGNNKEYPLVWSNLSNTSNITTDLLYKSYSNLTYNPHLNRIKANIFKAGNSSYHDGFIELYEGTPFIDFHYNNSTADYTNRIIEGLAGLLTVTGKFRIGLPYGTSTDYKFYVNGTGAFNLSLHLMEGAELHLKAAANSTNPGDIVFKDGNNTEVGRIYKSPAENNFYVRFSSSDSGKTMLHSGNSSVSDYAVKINNTTKNFVRDWRSGATDMNAVAKGGRSSMGMASLKTPSGGTATAVNPDGLTDWHHFINIAYTDGGNGSNSWITQIANKAGSTDLWVRSRKGGTIDNTVAWVAGWTRILTGSNYTSVLDGNYIKAYKTLNSTYSIDDDWGLSVVTFDPKALGTYPSSDQLANFTLLNLGNNFKRRKQFGFDWSTDSIFYRRHVDSAWKPWVTLLHDGNEKVFTYRGILTDTKDLNSITKTGTYYTLKALNLPTSFTTWYGNAINFTFSNTDTQWQLWAANTYNNTSLLFRKKQSSNWSDWWKIWHDGNDGSGSGLDADLLDGVHANGLLTALSSGTTNKVSITVGGTTKNITTLYASYLCSVGTVNPLTGRTLAYGNVYSYNTNVNYHEGAPTTYTSVIGFGRGTAGTVEICGEWTSGRGLWARALRNVDDDWYAWDRILTEATYKTVLDSRYVNVSGDTMNGHLTITNTEESLGTLLLKTGTATNKPRIRFEGDRSWGYLGFSGANKPCYYDNSLNEYTLWHSGNDGSGSGLNADVVDGYHISVVSSLPSSTSSSTIYFVTS